MPTTAPLPADHLDCPQHGRQHIEGWHGLTADTMIASLACGCELPDPDGPTRVLRAHRKQP